MNRALPGVWAGAVLALSTVPLAAGYAAWWALPVLIACVVLPFVVPGLYGLVMPGMVLVWFVLLLVLPCVLIVITAKTPRELILVLQLTSMAALAYGVLLGIGFAF